MSDQDRVLEIVIARSYQGEDVFMNDEGKFDVRQVAGLQDCYERGRQAKAWYKPIVDNPHAPATDEWFKWREGWNSLDMPSKEALARLKDRIAGWD